MTDLNPNSAFCAALLRVSPADDPAIRLGIVERRPPVTDPALPPLLLVHGATFPGRIFDLPRVGYSLLEALAAQGRAVYTLDVRGFGLSPAPRVMDAPPGGNPPFADASQAACDLTAAVALILDRHAVPALDLAGFSWGAILAARFAGGSPAKLRRLALYAPIYRHMDLSLLGRMAALTEDGLAREVYGLITADDVLRRWDGGLPTNRAAAYREPDLAELLFDTIAALDPRAGSHKPPAFRCPRGPLTDLIRIARGQTLFDPAALSMPTLLVRGAQDTTSTEADCRDLLARIESAEKAYEAIPDGSHFLLLEHKRAALYDRLNSFFGRGPA